MTTATLLHHHDLCARRAWLSTRWKPPFLTPKQILYESVEYGLSSGGDAGEAAEVHAMDLAVSPGIDSGEPDLLELATHIGVFANLLVWLLQGTAGVWKRPEAISLPDGAPWDSSAFLSAAETHLRRVVLVDRWDSWAQLALERSWSVLGECSVYGVGMDCLIVEIGSLRSGRWANPFTRAYRHPVSKTLRFRKRDGDDFGSTWEKVEREHDSASREEWLDALTDDGVLAEYVRVHQVQRPSEDRSYQELAQRRIGAVIQHTSPPDPNLSMCFDRIHPCPFRSCCPRGLGPSPETGFVQITSSQ